MTKQITIIGAGLAGLLAGTMLRHRAEIVEKQLSLPNNHQALLRFKTNIFSTAIGIPFKKVRMIKAVYGDNSNPIKNELNYARKVIGQYRSDRSLPVGVIKEDRYIAPPDLIEQMASMCKIEFDEPVGEEGWGEVSNEISTISTMPMPALMNILCYPKRKNIKFEALEGHVITADVKNCDAYVTYYFTGVEHSAYRASITGSKLIIEATGVTDPSIDNASSIASYYIRCFGIHPAEISNIKSHHMRYAKILPIDDEVRKEFMHWATINFNIYSLGRFATWRPGLLLDDLVNDVNLIHAWTMKGGKYHAAKHW